MPRKILVVCIIVMFGINLSGKGYKINVDIKGAKSGEIYLAIHYGESKFVKDTAYLNDFGKATFQKDTILDEGMYLLAIDGMHILDFLISDEKNQTFSIEAEKDKYTSTLKFKNSPENTLFADMTRFLAQKHKQERELSQNKDISKDQLKEAVQKLEDEFSGKLNVIKSKFPNGLLYSLMNSMQPYNTPEYNLAEDTPHRDSLMYVYYYNLEKEHFWDNFNLADKRLQNTPILIPAMDRYFMNTLIKIPDSITPAIDKFLAKAETSMDMQMFLAAHLFNDFMNSDIMGMESVVIHLIDNYYINNKIEVKDEKFLKDVAEFANKNRPTLIGQPATKLEMENVIGQIERLHDINSPYTLLYFFEPNCGHCKKITPKVYEVYQKYKDKGLAAYCVYTQDNKEEWVEYLAANNMDWTNVWDPKNINNFRINFSIYSVPILYLLDKDKKIIGRRLGPENLEQMLEHLITRK